MGQLAIKSGALLPFRAARDRFSLAYLQPVPTAWWEPPCHESLHPSGILWGPSLQNGPVPSSPPLLPAVPALLQLPSEGTPGGQALWPHPCGSPGAAAPRFQPPAAEQGPAGPGTRRVRRSPPGVSAGRPAAGARLFSAGATRRSLQTAPGAPGASRCSRRCWGSQCSQCSQCVLLLLRASQCSQSSKCSCWSQRLLLPSGFLMLPLHPSAPSSPQPFTLVPGPALPGVLARPQHPAALQPHSHPHPSDPTSPSAVPWEATGKGQIQSRAFPEPYNGPWRTWGGCCCGFDSRGGRTAVGCHQEGGYKGDGGSTLICTHVWAGMRTVPELCCWARLPQAPGFEASCTSPLLSGPVLLPAALHLPRRWGWGRPIPPGSLHKSHPNPAPALGVGGFASAGDTQPRRGTPSGEAAAVESHREKLPRVGRGLWQPRDVQR